MKIFEPLSSKRNEFARRNAVYSSINFLGPGIAVLLYFWATIARIGTGNIPSLIPLVLSLTIQLLPEAIGKQSALSIPLLRMCVLFFFFILGWGSILLKIDLGIILYLSFCVSILSNFRNNEFGVDRARLIKWTSTVFLSMVLIAQLWNLGYLNPLAPEAYIVGFDFVHVDTLFSASITGMIKTHLIASTGLFGLEPLNYHLGSHFMFAALSQLCKVDVLQFYNIGGPVIFVPLFCQGMLYASMANSMAKPGYIRILISIIFLFFILCELFGSEVGNLFLLPATLNAHFYSQSYGLSLTFTFFAIGIYYPLLLKGRPLHFNKIVQTVLILIIPVWFFIIGYTKISTGVVMLSAFVFIIVRKKLLLNKWLFISSILSVMSILFCYRLTTETNENTFFIQLGSFYTMYVKGNLVLYFLLAYWWTILLIILTAIIYRKKTGDLHEIVISGKFVVAEIVLVVAVVGILPGLLIHIEGSSAIYFSEIQYWLSAIVVMSLLPWVTYKIYRNTRRIAIVTTCLIFVTLMIVAFTGLYSFFRRNFQIRTALVYGNEAKFSQFMKSVSWETLITTLGISLKDSGDYEKNLTGEKRNLFESLRKLPVDIRVNAILFCEDVQELELFLECHQATFYITAMSEMPTINGLYWKTCFPDMRYGMQSYQKRPDRITKEEAFQLARQNGFKNIVVLNLKNNSFSLVKL